MKIKHNMSFAYFTVVFGILIAKAAGFVRDIIFAGAFGTTVESDIYFQIYGVVNLVFTCLGIALSTLVIKNLNKEENATEEKKRAYVSAFLQKTALWLLIVTAVLYAGARLLVDILLPNIDEQHVGLAVRLTYLMLPSLFCVVIAYIISGVLQNNRVFFIPSIVSLPYNALIISTLLVPDVSITTVAAATTIGWFLHIVFQLPSFYKKGYRFFLTASSSGETSGEKAVTKTSKETGKSRFGAVPREIAFIFISNLMFQLCFIIDKVFVSGDEGMIATVNYASNLFVTISSVFVVAMSNVVFPAISKNYEEGQIDYVRRLLRYIITFMFVIFVPYLLVVSLFGRQIIALLYERGSFTSDSTSATATAFAIYSFGILGYVAQELFNKILYLASRYRITVTATISVAVAKVALDAVLVPRFGAMAAAVTTTFLLTIYAIVVATTMRHVVGAYLNHTLAKNIMKVIAGAAAALVVYLGFYFTTPGILTSRVMFVVPLLVCGVVYIIMLLALGLLRSLFSDIKTVRQKTDGGEDSVI